MTLLIQQALDHIRFELGKPLPPQINPMHVVNMAGRHLVGMRAWNWLLRPPSILAITAGQDHIDLPADFGDLIGLFAFDETLYTARFIGMEELGWRRATQVQQELVARWCALGCSASDYPLDRPPQWRLELFPTPTTAVANALYMVYRAGWLERTSDAQYLPIDQTCDNLFIEILLAIAQGLMKSHEATVSQRLSLVRQGDAYLAAASMDIRRSQSPTFQQPRPRAIWPVPKTAQG